MKQHKVNYWFDSFNNLNSFDIISYEMVIGMYEATQSKLNESKFEKLGGDNEEPLNSDVEVLDNSAFWLGHDPRYYNVEPNKRMVTPAKSDVVSMDMRGLYNNWDSFVYLEIPYDFFNKYQTSVHSNSDISIFRKFIKELNTTNFSEDVIESLIKSYDIQYPTKTSITNFFRTYDEFAWSIDCEPYQYKSIKTNGIIYPICYNSKTHILDRGSHRTFFLAETNSYVPIFVQYPKMNNVPLTEKWEVKLGEYFGNGKSKMVIDMQNKNIEYYNNNKLIETY
jgi:hypothetical protein